MNPITQRFAPRAVTMPRPASPSRAVASLAWAAPMLATAGLGLYEIGVPMLWRDELASWSAASRTLPQLWTMVHHTDAVLGVYYLGLHLWMTVFGDSAIAMRVPSVIAMAGAAAAVALTGRRLGGTGAGLASGLLFAVLPSVSRYAQEARPYAFAAFFAALATLQLLRAVERPRWQRWGGYALVLAAAGAANLVALCVLAGHVVIVGTIAWQRTARRGGSGARASAEAAVPAAPAAGTATAGDGWPLALLAGFCLSAAAAVTLDMPIVIEGHAQAMSQIGRQPVPSFAELTGVSGGLWPQLFCSVPVAVAVIVLAVASVPVAPRRAAAAWALAGAVLPIVAVWLVSQGPASYWTVRYLLFTVPSWALSAGLCIAGTGERLRRWRSLRRPLLSPALQPCYAVAAGLVLAVGLLGVHDQRAIRQPEAHNRWAYPLVVANGEPADYQGAAGVIAAHERPGDGIVFQVSDHNHYQVDTSVAYYLRGKPTPRPVFQAETPAQAGSLQPAECASPARCLTGTPRLWVVYVNHLVPGSYLNPFLAMPADEAAVLRARGYRVQARYEEDGMTVALLVPR